MEKPLVSVCCTSYNHERWIRDAIDGFLMQRTDFPFEVIIHDDASLDATAEIISEYAEKHPEIIRPILQTENQHSKGVRASAIAFKESLGKYVAFCEGDDYWLDPHKLQRQIEAMERHPECHISFHPAVQKIVDGSEPDRVVCQHHKDETIIPVEQVIVGGGGFMPTASLIHTREARERIDRFFEIAPEAPVGDYYMQVIGAANGGALYVPFTASAYRSGAPGSWSVRFKQDPEFNSKVVTAEISTYRKLDAYLDGAYSSTIDFQLQKSFFSAMMSPYLPYESKKRIIDENLGDLNRVNQLLWHSLYKRRRINRLLSSDAMNDMMIKMHKEVFPLIGRAVSAINGQSSKHRG